ncbi:MAG: UvrD-helicase domain-containing protein [Actinomycetota bacterium]|nr:UvrD-helicase domain-containing protein [Actinomycetota bacterium]
MSTAQLSLFAAEAPGEDDEARALVTGALDETLFVEAGAGSGKTRALVDRVVGLVRTGKVPMSRIAAITFTEKAAAELRERVRLDLEARAAGAGVEGERCRAALDELDGAAVSTLHAFAQRLLSEHATDVGLPPRIEVLDEIRSEVAFEERWLRLRDALLTDPGLERSLLIGLEAGMRVDQLRDIARAFGDNWDLVAERVPADAPEPPEIDVAPVLDAVDTAVALGEHCIDDRDTSLVRLAQVRDWARALRAAPDELSRLRVLEHDAPSFKAGRIGRKTSYPSAECSVDDVRAAVVAIGGVVDGVRAEVVEASLHRLAAELGRGTLVAADERRAEGRLEFHDLLVLARRLLRDPERGPEVRASLAGRYERLLIDEFQDTDPIQIDLASLLATAPGPVGERPWDELAPEPGRLFLVGDPKQSIYRFRRADLAVFLRAAEALGPPVHLTRNFRSTQPVVAWVNHAFSRLIVADEHRGQAAYRPLGITRGSPPVGPGVGLLGAATHDETLDAAELRAREAHDVVAAVRTAMAEGWSVSDGRDAEGNDRWRPCRLGDIAVLLPARTSLAALESELEAAGIAFRAETTSLVYATPEIRDLTAVLRAIDDPSDQLSLLTALRSAAFGCGDDDLWRWRHDHRGSWNHQAPIPEGLDPATDPVAEAMTWLGRLHRQRRFLAPGEIVDRVVRERRLLELALAEHRPRDVWRRLRFVVDQARAFADSTGGGLRELCEWIRLQSAEGARVPEVVLPETDDDALRILTVHGSKGLEFPITILSGLTTRPQRRRGGAQVVFPPDGGFGIKVSASLTTSEYERFQPLDEQLDHLERLRLLYVAATRARDHLVVSMHRFERSLGEQQEQWTAAELLASAGRDGPSARALEPAETAAGRSVEPAGADGFELPEPSVWEAAHQVALAAAAAPRTRSATALAKDAVRAAGTPVTGEPVEGEPIGDEPADGEVFDLGAAGEVDPGLDKGGVDLELPPWNKGRYGTAIGRAVHAVLQTAELTTGEGIDDAAAAQAAAEAVVDHTDLVARLARAALTSPAVTEAAAGRHWRELYVAAPVGDRLVEGYVDLFYRGAAGWTVVDYKTDAVARTDDLDRAVDRYRIQAAAYAAALAATIGEPVERAVILFLTPSGPIEREVPDLRTAIAEVTTLVSG